eukprot:7384993-Prymnesium_polylepis.1
MDQQRRGRARLDVRRAHARRLKSHHDERRAVDHPLRGLLLGTGAFDWPPPPRAGRPHETHDERAKCLWSATGRVPRRTAR